MRSMSVTVHSTTHRANIPTILTRRFSDHLSDSRAMVITQLDDRYPHQLHLLRSNSGSGEQESVLQALHAQFGKRNHTARYVQRLKTWIRRLPAEVVAQPAPRYRWRDRSPTQWSFYPPRNESHPSHRRMAPASQPGRTICQHCRCPATVNKSTPSASTSVGILATDWAASVCT